MTAIKLIIYAGSQINAGLLKQHRSHPYWVLHVCEIDMNKLLAIYLQIIYLAIFKKLFSDLLWNMINRLRSRIVMITDEK